MVIERLLVGVGGARGGGGGRLDIVSGSEVRAMNVNRWGRQFSGFRLRLYL